MLINLAVKAMPQIPDLEGRNVMMWDNNCSGWMMAIERLERKPDEDVWRFVIPFSDSHLDVSDYLLANSHEEVKGIANAFPINYEFPILKIERNQGPSVSTWPRKSTQTLADYRATRNYLLTLVQLPDIVSGRNLMQEYMAHHTENENAVCKEFGVLPKVVETNLMRMPVLDDSPLPVVLIQGQVPFDPKWVKDAIKQYINNKTGVDWGSAPLDTTKGKFTRCGECSWLSSAVVDKHDCITRLPYGVTRTQFMAKNPECFDQRTWKVPVLFKGPFAQIEFKIQPCEQFLNRKDPARPLRLNLNEFVAAWCALRLKYHREMREVNIDSKIRRERRMRVCWTIMTKQTIDDKPLSKRQFIEETVEEKEARIARDFDNDQTLMNIPLRDIGPEIIPRAEMFKPRLDEDPPTLEDLLLEALDS
jgi:hypothetical protein